MTAATNHSWRPSDSLANRFRLVRADLGLTQKEFGDIVGIPPHQIQTIEDGKAGRHLDVKVKKIALALGVDRDWLMWGGSLGDGPSNEGPDGGETEVNEGTPHGEILNFPPPVRHLLRAS